MSGTEYYRMTAGETLEHFGSGPEGLPREKARSHREEYGRNEITAALGVPKWVLFLKQFRDLLVVVLIVAGVISLSIGSYRDGGVMFAIVVINAVIGFVQEYKAGRIIEKLRDMIRSPAKVMVDGALQELPQADLVPGDVVQIEAGDKIPADLRILECYDLRTNEFSLTGESMSQEKESNAIDDERILADRDNMAWMGTTVATGSATGVVVATGMDTEMGKIAGMTESAGEVRSPLQRELGVLARWLTGIGITVCVGVFALSLLLDFGLVVSLIYALGIAVAVVPQALPAQVTVALSTASRRLAARKAVVKNLPSVETLGSTTVICTDKTGTLTKNEMTVTTVWFDGREYRVTGIGYEPEGEILGPDGKPLDQAGIDEIEIMMDAATMASNAEIHPPDGEHSGWYPIGDPTEAALVACSTKLGTRSPTEDQDNPELHEFPFESERKRMSSVRQFGERRQLALKGATDSVLSISRHIWRDGKAVPITDEDRQRIAELAEGYADRALRVLAIAYRPLSDSGDDYVIEEVERDVVFLGLMCMIDPPKDGVAEAIEACHDARIRVLIMTGDHAITARAVGREIGLSRDGDPEVHTGLELSKMDDGELGGILSSGRSLIFSRVNPGHKLRIVKLLQDQGEVVAVTGDGVNDAPALKRAAIGVAMGQTGTDVAKEAARLVLLDDSFPTLVDAVREGRTIYGNLRKTVLASMTTNAAELAVVLFGLAGVAMRNWAIPILALQVLAIDLLAEIMPLTFLTYDPPTPGIMSEPPRKQGQHIMNRGTAREVLLFGLLIGALSFGNYWLYMVREGISFASSVSLENPVYLRATTMAYLTIAFCQFMNVLSRRHRLTSLFNRNFFTNRVLLASIAGSIALLLLVLGIPQVGRLLYLVMPGPVDWLFVLGAAGVFLAVFESVKAFKRARAGGGEG
ncbi:MAG: cation-translocating P-type ATPase [Candidatus Fermentibacterota bacterium]